jgi:cytochrome d ubiquinol oxidase subunit I
MYLLVIPGEDGNALQALPLPGVLSFLAYNDFNAEVKGLNDIPKEDRPPVVLSFLSFRLMVGLGTLFPLLAAFGWVMRNKLDKFPLYLKAMPYVIPLPYIAIWAGWTLTEVGRQPWIVYGLMRTSDAVSPVGAGEVGFTLVLMTVLYALLGAVGIWLMVKLAKKGPEDHTPIQV